MDPQNKYLVSFTAHFLARQTRPVSTIKVLPTPFHQRRLTGQMILANDPPTYFWKLHATGAKDEALNSDNLIFSNSYLVRMVACLVHNQLYKLKYIFPLKLEGLTLLKNFNFYHDLSNLNQAFPLFDSGLKNRNLRWSTEGHSLVFIILNFKNPALENLKKINFILTPGWREIWHFTCH